MANYYAPIAPFRTGPGINLEPVNAALDGILQQQNQNRSFGLQQQASDRADQQLKISQGEFGLQQDAAKRQKVSDLGKQALAIDQLTDPNQRAAAWQGWVRAHGADGLTPEEMDPMTGPKLAAAQAGQYLDPLDRQTKIAGLELTQAQIKAANQKNTLNDAIAGIITGAGGQPTAAPPQGAPSPGQGAAQAPATVQPQSYNGQPTMPGVQLTADTTTVPGTPAPQAAAQPDMVNTPIGPMTKQRAQQLGFGLAMSGRGDAGKMFSDAANSNALDKGAATENDKTELSSTAQLATLNAVRDSFDPKFLNIPNRIGYAWNALQDKFGVLSPQDKADLNAYTQWRGATWRNLNVVLKQLSGTAVTGDEMQRQLLDQPNPGKGIGDGDSPTEFEAKLRNQFAFAQSAIARARWLRTQGFKGNPWDAGVSVDQMPAIINQRGAQIEQDLRQRNPNASPMQLQQATTRQIKQEFGI